MKKTTSRHITVKLLKSEIKRKFLKQPEEGKYIPYRATKMETTAGFSSEIIQTKRATSLKCWGENSQPRILYLVKLSFKSQDEIFFQTHGR